MKKIAIYLSIILIFTTCKKKDCESCDDGIMNQNETGIDCGGICQACNISNNTLVLQPDSNIGKDAMIRYFGSNGDNINYGAYALMTAFAGTSGGTELRHRSLLQFNLTVLPTTSNIVSATLSLYGDSNSSAFPMGHISLNDTNSWVIKRITSMWGENIVTWNNQPSTTSQNNVLVPGSTSNYQNYNVDVKNIVQSMVSNPQSNFGFMIMLQNEIAYNRLVFGSSDNVNQNLHPKLTIVYN